MNGGTAGALAGLGEHPGRAAARELLGAHQQALSDARALIGNGNFAEAASVLKKAIELLPDEPEAHVQLARAHAGSAGTGPALAELRLALEAGAGADSLLEWEELAFLGGDEPFLTALAALLGPTAVDQARERYASALATLRQSWEGSWRSDPGFYSRRIEGCLTLTVNPDLTVSASGGYHGASEPDGGWLDWANAGGPCGSGGLFVSLRGRFSGWLVKDDLSGSEMLLRSEADGDQAVWIAHGATVFVRRSR